MNITVESKLEYQNNSEDINCIYKENIENMISFEDNNLYLLNDNIKLIETDITNEILNVDDELFSKEIDSNINNKHLLFTNILNDQKKEINRKEYLSWLNSNYELLQSAYYILSTKYFNKNINFEKFSEFCFLYY
jgi:hypothetical protein